MCRLLPKSNHMSVLLLAVWSIFLISCSSAGSSALAELDVEYLNNAIIIGETDVDTVADQLGEPSDIIISDAGNLVWSYQYHRVVPRAQSFIPYIHFISSVSDVTKKKLVIVFDENNKVKRYAMIEAQEEARSGLFE